MTSNEKAIAGRKALKLLGWLFLALAVIIAIAIIAENLTGLTLVYASVACFVGAVMGIGLILVSDWLKKIWWNGLSLDEKCSIMAAELKSGKRGWYLNSFVDTGFFFAPLSKNNMNEFGGGKHTPTTREKVLQLLKEGKIENSEVARLTLYHFEWIR